MAAAAARGYFPPREGRRARKTGGLKSLPIQIVTGERASRLPRFHAELLLEMIRLAASGGFESVVRVSNGTYQEFMEMLPHIKSQACAAVIVLGDFSAPELRAILGAVPGAILLDNPGDGLHDGIFNSFAFDNGAGADLAATHLLERGRRDILVVTGPEEHFFSREVTAGCRTALERAGMELPPEQIINTDFSGDSAAAGVAAAVRSGFRPDGVITNDEMAGGVYRALTECGLTIPGDTAVVGCDNLPVGLALYPRLTTVMLDPGELARQVVDFIISGRRNVPVKVRLTPKLVPRESS